MSNSRLCSFALVRANLLLFDFLDAADLHFLVSVLIFDLDQRKLRARTIVCLIAKAISTILKINSYNNSIIENPKGTLFVVSFLSSHLHDEVHSARRLFI